MLDTKTTNNLLLRDDDVNVYTCIYEFKRIHEQFINKKLVHTVAVIMKDLWQNQAIFYYLATAPYLDIGLHGWEHIDYSIQDYNKCFNDLSTSLTYWKVNSERMVGKQAKKITTFFAPWNKEGKEIKKACDDLGLKFCNIRKGYWEGFNIRSFHWWSYEDTFGNSK